MNKQKETPIARLAFDGNGLPCCLLFKPTRDLTLGAGWVHCLDLKKGICELYWGDTKDKGWVKHLFASVKTV